MIFSQMLRYSGYATSINFSLFYILAIISLVNRNLRIVELSSFIVNTFYVFFFFYLGNLILFGNVAIKPGVLLFLPVFLISKLIELKSIFPEV